LIAPVTGTMLGGGEWVAADFVARPVFLLLGLIESPQEIPLEDDGRV
jgi:hypothetical protein